MRKFSFLAPVLLAFTLVVGCSTMGNFMGDDELVVTSASNVAEGVTAATVPVASLPEAVRRLVPEGMDVVVIDKDDLVSPTAPYIPLMGEFGDTAIGTAVDAGLHIATTFFPALAGWEALLAVFFRRKRKHYSSAFKALIPSDRNMDIGGALSSLTAALGMSHSSPTTEDTWEAELEDMEG